MRPKYMKITQSQLQTLLYWARVGGAERGRRYEKQFPNRLRPHDKILNIEYRIRGLKVQSDENITNTDNADT